MKKLIYKLFIVAAVFLFTPVLFSSCSKDDDTTTNSSSEQDYFTSNAVNRDLFVGLASDNSTDITTKFNGYNIRLTSTAALSGTIAISNDLLTVNGTWTIDAGYNKITFAIPTTTIADLGFMNKEWQFASRSSTTIDLVSTDGEGDKLQLARK